MKTIHVKIHGTGVPAVLEGQVFEVHLDADDDIHITSNQDLLDAWSEAAGKSKTDYFGYVWGPKSHKESKMERGYTEVPAPDNEPDNEPEPTPEPEPEVPTEAPTEVTVTKVIVAVTPGNVEDLEDILSTLSSYDLLDRVTLG